MNKIDSIIIHCSATRAGQDLTAKDIDRMHRARGFSQIGYNYVIRIDGAVEKGRSLAVDGAHCNTKGFSESSYNKHSVGICYIGGLDANGKPADTRTIAQKAALRELVAKLCKEYEIIEVLGHRPEYPVKEAILRPVAEWKDILINDFEASVFPQHPVIGEIKEELYHQGAIYASMSGSGSSVFGLFAPGFVLPEIDWGTDVFCFKGTLNK